MEDKMNERDDNYKEMVVKLIIVKAYGNTEHIVRTDLQRLLVS